MPENKIVHLDFTKAIELGNHPVRYGSSKSIKGRGRAKLDTIVARKRIKWWIDHCFGTEAAEWAASYRLGKPIPSGRTLTHSEKVSYKNAIYVAERRVEIVNIYIQQGMTKENAIKMLDRRLRIKDLKKRIIKGTVAPSLSINDSLVESNIFRDESP